MTSKSLSVIVEKVQSITCYQVGSNRISRSGGSSADYNSIVVGLVLWFGILLDHNSILGGDTKVVSSTQGRIVKCPMPLTSKNAYPLDMLLLYLDELNDILLETISCSGQFKAAHLVKRIVSCYCEPQINAFKGIICGLLRRDESCVAAGESSTSDFIKRARQIFGFFKKLDIDRPDLAKVMEKDFWSFEDQMSENIRNQACDPEYAQVVSEMRAIYLKHIEEYSIKPFVPKHGPGSVADTRVKCWYDKNMSAKTDARVKHLMDHDGLGTEADYLPYVKETVCDRTSRFITVPKTWKKLRGISAEPAELQFWQQGVLHSIETLFTKNKWWAARVNLSDQTLSSELAKLNSLTKEHATVDLSAASDSVSTQLVRDVFKNTVLGRWLLGTRSTHTLCGGVRRKIHKFAPMGSAVCFPTEIMIFILASEVACSRTYEPTLDDRGQVQVFGDDIILPSYAVHELFKILATLGFSINTEKSYWVGSFREACGMEAWRGVDIRPCRYKTCKTGPFTTAIDHDDLAMLVSLSNGLFDRELHTARAWLLTILFRKYIQLSDVKVRTQHTLFTTFSGESGTLSSPMPTNFQLKRKFFVPYQTYKVKRVIWREMPIHEISLEAYASNHSQQKYTEWLINHQVDAADFDWMWSKGYLIMEEEKPYARLPIGMKMVPTLKWVLPVSINCLEVGKSSDFNQI